MDESNKKSRIQEIVEKLLNTKHSPTSEELTEEKCPECGSYLYNQFYDFTFTDYIYHKCKNCGYKKLLCRSTNSIVPSDKMMKPFREKWPHTTKFISNIDDDNKLTINIEKLTGDKNDNVKSLFEEIKKRLKRLEESKNNK